jgi:2-hydroxy-3-oxopropionate reductase
VVCGSLRSTAERLILVAAAPPGKPRVSTSGGVVPQACRVSSRQRARKPVGFVGLGNMGRPMARNLVRAGHRVVVWNRSAGPAGELAAAGARLARTPAELARAAPAVLTMLPDLPQVEDVLFRDGGLLAGMGRGSVLVVMGTVSPVDVRALGARLDAAGVALVDAPVSGGDVGAEQAALSIMVGGRRRDVARVRPFFEAMGTTIEHLGPLGAGQLAKACNQIVVAATLTALAEALLLAEGGGLDPRRVFEVLAGGLAGSRVLELKGEKLLGRDFRPGGAARFQHKDLGFALAAARSEGVTVPLTALVDQLYAAACSGGFGDDDHSVVLRVLERLARA